MTIGVTSDDAPAFAGTDIVEVRLNNQAMVLFL